MYRYVCTVYCMCHELLCWYIYFKKEYCGRVLLLSYEQVLYCTAP